MPDDAQDAADGLYAVPPAEFIPARTAAVAAARADGDKAAAAALAALRKPTVSAWLVNRLARSHPDIVDDAMGLGARLRDATTAGDRDALRELASRRAQLVSELVRHARAIAEEHGQAMTAETQREIESTFTAAAIDETAAAAVRSGRLTSPLTFEGFGFDQGALPPPRSTSAQQRTVAAKPRTPTRTAEPATPSPAKVATPPRTSAAAAQGDAARARAEQEAVLARAAEEAERALAVARLQQADADAGLADAEQALEQATRTETEAAAAYEQARTELDDAWADVRDARKDAAAAARTVVAALNRLERARTRTRPH